MSNSFNLEQFEAVDGALSALRYAGDFMTCADPRSWIRKSNVLLDACVHAGMDYAHDDHVGWATEYVIAALVAV